MIDLKIQFILKKNKENKSNKGNIFAKKELMENKNNNSCCCTETCQSSCGCCPCLPCFNPCRGCCQPCGPCFDPRFCDPRSNPCGRLLHSGLCMKPWLGSDENLVPSELKNICVLPSPQPVCNPDSRCPRSLGFPLCPPRPPQDIPCTVTVEEKPEPPKKESVGTNTWKPKPKPRPYLICPYFYPCPYPCSVCSGGYTPSYSDYSIGCPSTCLPRMSEQGMSVTPIPVPLPFGAAPMPIGCIEKCDVYVRKNSNNKRKRTLVPGGGNANGNNCKACQTNESDYNENTFNLTIDDDKFKIEPGCCKRCKPCSSCHPYHQWKLCRQRRMKFVVKQDKFCCRPKVCNHVGCFDKPIRNTVCFVSDYSADCLHPYVPEDEGDDDYEEKEDFRCSKMT